MAKKLGVSTGIKGKTFIVQGFGNVGYWASKFFTEAGAKLIGVGEFDGSIYNADGLSPDQIMTFKKSHGGGIKNFSNAKYFKDDQALYKKT